MGAYVTSFTAIAFGFLEYIENKFAFLGLSIVLRLLESVGQSAQYTGVLTLITENFYENVGKAFSINELLLALSMAIGPVFGGGLVKVGGFLLPFEVAACIKSIFII